MTDSTGLGDLHTCAWDVTNVSAAEVTSIKQQAALHGDEAAIVASCQRVEVYHQRDGCDCAAQERWHGRAAIARMAEVAAGLHSIVLGEAQILGQVRTALAESAGPPRQYGEVAVAAARALRRETQWDTDSGHLLDRALALTNTPPQGSLLVLGAGSMARLVARRAFAAGFNRVTIASRRPHEDHWFAPHRADHVLLSDITSLADVDVVVTCLGSGAPPIAAASLPAAGLVVDLGGPRNIAGLPANATFVAISDLAAASDHTDAASRQVLRNRLG